MFQSIISSVHVLPGQHTSLRPSFPLTQQGTKHVYTYASGALSEKERFRFLMPKTPVLSDKSYAEFVSQLVAMLERARRHSARSINSIMTAT